jgi:acetyl-CoA C-acetyltransferase
MPELSSASVKNPRHSRAERATFRAEKVSLFGRRVGSLELLGGNYADPMTEAVIVATARSPIGRASKGSLVDLRPDDMSAEIVKALMQKVPQVSASDVEDLLMGCGQPAGEAGFNIARVTALLAGLGDVPGVTVNRYCSSSLQTIRMAAHAIKAGEGDCFIAAGVEAVSRYGNGASDTAPNPVFKPSGARTRERSQGGAPVWEPTEGLPDVYIAMGQTAENVVQAEGVTRDEMDEFAARSQQLAVTNVENGFWEDEITPLTLPDGTVVSKDDGPRAGTTVEGLSQLKPVFRPDGSVTAGNACPLNDGAAAVMVMSDTKAKALGITPLARIVASGVSALNPEIMGLGPIEACRQALARAGMTIDEIDLVEINEAFAAQVIPSAKHLEIPWEKLNVNGGSIALGHPFGMTGARIMTTLIHGLIDADKRFGLETMCVGGGQGMAMIIERLN